MILGVPLATVGLLAFLSLLIALFVIDGLLDGWLWTESEDDR